MTETEKEQIESMMERKVAELMEMCDTVQIVVTKHDSANNATMSISRGAGNVFARMASVDDWIASNH
jgi:alpha-D-ribose 1-methylphosphonate 5-triphosphate diphosphatase PhnM